MTSFAWNPVEYN